MPAGLKINQRKMAWDSLYKKMVVDDNMMIGKKIGEVLRPKVDYTNHKENV